MQCLRVVGMRTGRASRVRVRSVTWPNERESLLTDAKEIYMLSQEVEPL